MTSLLVLCSISLSWVHQFFVDAIPVRGAQGAFFRHSSTSVAPLAQVTAMMLFAGGRVSGSLVDWMAIEANQLSALCFLPNIFRRKGWQVTCGNSYNGVATPVVHVVRCLLFFFGVDVLKMKNCCRI